MLFCLTFGQELRLGTITDESQLPYAGANETIKTLKNRHKQIITDTTALQPNGELLVLLA
jgi:hypothetical protein